MSKSDGRWIYGRSEMAKYLDMSYQTLARMELDGLPHYKPRRGTVMYDKEEVEEYIRGTRVNRGRLMVDIGGGSGKAW